MIFIVLAIVPKIKASNAIVCFNVEHIRKLNSIEF